MAELGGQLRADELVRAAMAASGAGTARALARELGLSGYESPKRVERWLRGENSPDFDMTIRLLQLAGLLTESRLVKARAAAEAAQARAEATQARRRRSPRAETGT